ncbi:MAG TPA: HAD family hydrolase [Tepidisphaeraceae bacterium]|nr:HAD family hydrolase [Tepidisphaeraceae bacterium]
MKRPAVFFDRDNTLIVSDGYLGDPARVELMEGAAAAVARARELGFATVIVSNQSGVARGMFDEDAVHAVNQRLDELLAAQNPHAVIDRHEFCPHHPEATVARYRDDSDRRKPKAGMIHEAAEALALDLSRSWLIGDAPRDIEAGKAAGCRTILLRPNGVAASPAASAASDLQPDHTVTSLQDAMDYIAQHPATREHDREHEDDPGATGGVGENPARDESMSIPHHPHLPPRIESAARVDDPATTIAPPPHPAHAPHQPSPPPPAHSERQTREQRLHVIAEQILEELKRRHDEPAQDFSVSKMLAGIAQVMTLAVLFIAYLNHEDPVSLLNTLVFALTMQTMTIALLIMSRGR